MSFSMILSCSLWLEFYIELSNKNSNLYVSSDSNGKKIYKTKWHPLHPAHVTYCTKSALASSLDSLTLITGRIFAVLSHASVSDWFKLSTTILSVSNLLFWDADLFFFMYEVVYVTCAYFSYVFRSQSTRNSWMSP